MLQRLILLVFLCTVSLAHHDPRRSDDANSVAALEALLQQQAATIQALEARLDAQDTKMLEQTSTIHSLQASLANQQNTMDNLLGDHVTLRQLGDVNHTLNHRLDSLGNVQQQQVTTIQTQGSALQQQESTLQQQESTLRQHGTELQTVKADHQSMSDRISKQEQSAGFYADFGRKPYDDVTIATNQPMKFNRTLTNIGNGFDQTTGIFTTPYSGLYTFHLHFMGGSHNDTTNLGIYAGNQVLAIAYSEGYYRDNYDQGSCTAVSHLLKGQEVSVKLYYGNPMIWGSPLASFSGMLVQ